MSSRYPAEVAALVSNSRLILETGIEELRQRQQDVVRAIDAGQTAAAGFAELAGRLAMIEAATGLGGGA